jgi:LemA protein
MIWISVTLFSLAIFFLVTSYNKLVRDRNRVFSGWSDIEVQLQRRHALIPKLVAAIRQYADYEQATLQTLTELRSRAKQSTDISERSELENHLSQSLFSVIAVVEDYPDLKSNQNFLDLQQQISEIEQAIHFARRYYNGAVNNWNTRLQTFPDIIVARLFRFKPAEYFEYKET